MRLIIFDVETTGMPGMISYTDRCHTDLSKSSSFTTQAPKDKIQYKCKGEVIQLSALVCDIDTLDPVELISFYCMPTEPISDGAFNVHHISNNVIEELSKGKFLEDYLFSSRENGGYSDVFTSTGNLYVSYNTAFDMKAVNNTLAGYSMEIDFGKKVNSFIDFNDNYNYNLCAMEAFKSIKGLSRWVKLEESLKMMNYTTLDKDFEDLMRRCNKPITSSFHNADYDTVAAWALLFLLRPYL